MQIIEAVGNLVRLSPLHVHTSAKEQLRCNLALAYSQILRHTCDQGTPPVPTPHRRTGICDLDLPVRDTHPSTYSKASQRHSLHGSHVITELCLCAGI